MNTIGIMRDKVDVVVRGSKWWLTDERQAEVDRIWADQLKLKPNLHNGSMLSLEGSVIKEEIHCIPTDYKQFIAHRNGFDIGFPISPIAVSGMMFYVDRSTLYYIMGQRSEIVTQYPGYWEFIGSGSLTVPHKEFVGTIDHRQQLENEIAEEFGHIDIADMGTVGLIYDPDCNTWDIGYYVHIGMPDKLPDNSAEYSEIKAFSMAEYYMHFYENEDKKIVPTSTCLDELVYAHTRGFRAYGSF